METIFDHNITKEESMMMFDFETDLDIVMHFSQRDNHAFIYKLYLVRRNDEKAAEYAAKLPDDELKLFQTCNHDFAK